MIRHAGRDGPALWSQFTGGRACLMAETSKKHNCKLLVQAKANTGVRVCDTPQKPVCLQMISAHTMDLCVRVVHRKHMTNDVTGSQLVTPAVSSSVHKPPYTRSLTTPDNLQLLQHATPRTRTDQPVPFLHQTAGPCPGSAWRGACWCR